MGKYKYIVITQEPVLTDPINFYMITLSKPIDRYEESPLEQFQTCNNTVTCHSLNSMKGNISVLNDVIVFKIIKEKK